MDTVAILEATFGTTVDNIIPVDHIDESVESPEMLALAAARRDSNSETSKRVISPTPDLPSQSADHVSSTPIAKGVTSPKPVITTRLFKKPPPTLLCLQLSPGPIPKRPSLPDHCARLKL